MNEIKNIVGKQLSFQDKLKIKQLGPPRPDMSIQRTYHTKNRSYNRKFSRGLYDKCSWICGCKESNAFYCFPCALFCNAEAWATTGVSDLKHLDNKIKKHSECKTHLQNEMDFAMLGEIDIRLQLDDAYRLSVKKQHEQVDKNRYILSRIIDCIKFCGTHELALRGHDERKDSENPGIFRGLVEFVASLDTTVREHLENSKVFQGISKCIQNDILDAILDVTHAAIKHEIEETEYLSIQADETTDVSCTTQLALIFRYLVKGQIYERFWGFFSLENRSADGISACLLKELANVGVDNYPHKLIGQAYDGAPVMSGATGGVQRKIKEQYPAANFIHCYAHQGNLIMQQATSSCKQVKIFFSDIEGIGPFFHQSPKRTDILTEVVRKRMPQSVPTRWNFKSRIVNTVYENKDSLIECFEKISETFDDRNTISQASGFVRLLEDNNFLFWLQFFHSVMPHVDIFFNQIQQRNIDTTDVHKFTTDFSIAVNKIRECLCESSVSDVEESVERRKRSHRDMSLPTSKKASALEVCDTIINVAKSRFTFTEHLSAALLCMPENFEQFCKSFPEKHLDATISAFAKLEKRRLKTELEVLYSRDDLRKASGATSLLQFLLKNNLYTVFPETVKLLKIVVTLPMTTVENERCFSTLKRIKTFLRNTMGQDRVNALAMLSISRQLINSIPDFNKKVIDVFAERKNRRMEFNYK